MENLIVKLNFYKVISYLVDQCISLARSWSRQTLEKNVLSWALTGTGSVVLIRQVSPLHPAPLLRVCEHAHLLFLLPTSECPPFLAIVGKVGWESPGPLGKTLPYKNLI